MKMMRQLLCMVSVFMPSLIISDAPPLSKIKPVGKKEVVAQLAPNPLQVMSLEEGIEYLQDLIASESVANIADAMRGLSIERGVQVTQKVLTDAKNEWSHRNKIDFLFAVFNNYAYDATMQEQILALLLNNPGLYKGTPLLLSAVRAGYGYIIPALLDWREKKLKKGVALSDYLKNMIPESFSGAVLSGTPDELSELLRYSPPIHKDFANDLLWIVVVNNKDHKFVPVLVSAGANINVTKDKKYTPLIIATMNNNIHLVKTLLEAGANVDAVLDGNTGSALQIAVNKGYTRVEILLRKYAPVKKFF